MGRRSRRFIVTMQGIVTIKLNRGEEAELEKNGLSCVFIPLSDFATSSPLHGTSDSIKAPMGRHITSTTNVSAIRSDILLYDYMKENTILLSYIRRLLHMQLTPQDLVDAQFPKPSAAIIGYGESALKVGNVPNHFILAIEIITRLVRGNFNLFSITYGIDLNIPHTYAESISASTRANEQTAYSSLPPAIRKYTIQGRQTEIPLILSPIETLIFPTHLMLPGDYSSHSLFYPNRVRQIYLELLLSNSLLSPQLLRFYTCSELSSAKLEAHGPLNASMKLLGLFPEFASKALLNKNIKGQRYTLSTVFSDDLFQEILQKTNQQGFKADLYSIQEKNIKLNLTGGVNTSKRGRRRQLLTVSPQAISMGTPTSSISSLTESLSNLKTADIIKGIDDLSYLQCINILIPLRNTTDQGCVVFSELQFVQPTHLHTTPLHLSDHTKSLPVSPKQSNNTLTFTITDSDQDTVRTVSIPASDKLLIRSAFQDQRDAPSPQLFITRIVLGKAVIDPELPLPALFLDELHAIKELEPYYSPPKLVEQGGSTHRKLQRHDSKAKVASPVKPCTAEYTLKVVLDEPLEACLRGNDMELSAVSNESLGVSALGSSLQRSASAVASQVDIDLTVLRSSSGIKASVRGSQRPAAPVDDSSDSNSASSANEREFTDTSERLVIPSCSSFTRTVLNSIFIQKIELMQGYCRDYGKAVLSPLAPDFRTGVLAVGHASLESIPDLNTYTITGLLDAERSRLTLHSRCKSEIMEDKSKMSLLSLEFSKLRNDPTLKQRAAIFFKHAQENMLLTVPLPNDETLRIDTSLVESQYPSFKEHLTLTLSCAVSNADLALTDPSDTSNISTPLGQSFPGILFSLYNHRSPPLSSLVGSLIDLSVALNSLFVPSPMIAPKLVLGARDLVLHDTIGGSVPAVYLIWGLTLPYMQSILLRDRILCPAMRPQACDNSIRAEQKCTHGFFDSCDCVVDAPLDFLADILNGISWLLIENDIKDPKSETQESNDSTLALSPWTSAFRTSNYRSPTGFLNTTLGLCLPPDITTIDLSRSAGSFVPVFNDYESHFPPNIIFFSEYKEGSSFLSSFPGTRSEVEAAITSAALYMKVVDAILFGSAMQRLSVDIVRFEDRDLFPKAVTFLCILALIINTPSRLPIFTPLNLRLQYLRVHMVPYSVGSGDLTILDHEKKCTEHCSSLGISIKPVDATSLRASVSMSSLSTHSQSSVPGLNNEVLAPNPHLSWKIANAWKQQSLSFYINFQLYQLLTEGTKGISNSISFVDVLEQIIANQRLRPFFNISLLATIHDVLCYPRCFVPAMVYMPLYGYFFAKSIFDAHRIGGCIAPSSGQLDMAEYYGTVANISGVCQGLRCLYPTSTSLISNMSTNSLTGITALTVAPVNAPNTSSLQPSSTLELANYEVYGVHSQELESVKKATGVYSIEVPEGMLTPLVQSLSYSAVKANQGTKDAEDEGRTQRAASSCLISNRISYLLTAKHLNEGVYTYDSQNSLISNMLTTGQLSINLATSLLMTKLYNRKFSSFAKQLPSSQILPTTVLDLLTTSAYDQNNMTKQLQSLLDCGSDKSILLVAKLPQADDFSSLRAYDQLIKTVQEDDDPTIPFSIWDDIYEFVVENHVALFNLVDDCAFDFDEELMISLEAAILYDDIDFQTLNGEDDESKEHYYLQERRCGVKRTTEERRSVSALSNRLCTLSNHSDTSLTPSELELITLPNYCHSLRPLLNLMLAIRPSLLSYGSLDRLDHWESKDVIRLARCRGLEIGKSVLLGKISPDSEIAGTKKHPSYESVEKVMERYQRILQRPVTLGTSQILPIPVLDNASTTVGDNASEHTRLCGVQAPLFQRYTLLEERGAAPIFDIAQRELRSTVPYTLCTDITVKNTPLVPDAENPPNPSAEDSTNTFLTDYWSISIPKCRYITPERIRSLWNPLWSLEERTLDIIPLDPSELIKTPAERILREELTKSDAQYNNILNEDPGKSDNAGPAAAKRQSSVQTLSSKCACGSFHAVLLPSQSSFQQQTPHQSIFSMSPYYTPPDLGDDVSRDSVFSKLVLHAVQEVCLLIREYLDILANANRNQLSRSRHESYKYIDEAVWGYIISSIPVNDTCRHIRSNVSPQMWERKSTSSKARFGPHPLPSYNLQSLIGNNTVEEAISMMRKARKSDPHILSTIKNSALVKNVVQQSNINKYPSQVAVLKGIDMWGANVSLDARIAEIEAFLTILWKHYPLLNPLLIGDVDNRFFQTPYCIASAYESGFSSIHELEEVRCIRFLLRQGRSLENEVLDELLASQEKLRLLSKDCMKRRIRAIKMLEIERYNDIVAETEELCALYINTVWGKANHTDKRTSGARMTHEMQIVGAYESDGCIQNDAAEFLDIMEDAIRANGLRLGPAWEKDGFDYKDIM